MIVPKKTQKCNGLHVSTYMRLLQKGSVFTSVIYVLCNPNALNVDLVNWQKYICTWMLIMTVHLYDPCSITHLPAAHEQSIKPN